MKSIALVLMMSSLSFAVTKDEAKKKINETADQVDSGTRKAIKEVRGLVTPHDQKKKK